MRGAEREQEGAAREAQRKNEGERGSKGGAEQERIGCPLFGCSCSCCLPSSSCLVQPPQQQGRVAVRGAGSVDVYTRYSGVVGAGWCMHATCSWAQLIQPGKPTPPHQDP